MSTTKNYWALNATTFKKRIAKIERTYNELCAKDINDLHVSISEGNRKLGAIPSVSLIPHFDCVNNASCMLSCYDLRNDLMYNEVISSRCINSVMAHNVRERYFREIDAYITYRYPRAFRWHIGGDILDEDYLSRMCGVATNHPETKFLAFTKNFKACNAWLDGGNTIPPNMHILFSGWLGMKMDNPHHFPEAHPVFKNGTSAPDGAKLCTDNCTECLRENRMCWNLKPGEAVIFLAH